MITCGYEWVTSNAWRIYWSLPRLVVDLVMYDGVYDASQSLDLMFR